MRIELIELKVGSAATFRDNLNTNFRDIANAVNDDDTRLNNLEDRMDVKPTMFVQSTQPQSMQIGDLWIEP